MANTRKNRNRRNNMMSRKNRNNMMGGAKMPAVGSKLQVWNGNAKHTSGGLTRKDLMRTKHGRIVSRRKHAAGQKAIKNLRKLGYIAKKGTFKLFGKKRGGGSSGDDTMDLKMTGQGGGGDSNRNSHMVLPMMGQSAGGSSAVMAIPGLTSGGRRRSRRNSRNNRNNRNRRNNMYGGGAASNGMPVVDVTGGPK